MVQDAQQSSITCSGDASGLPRARTADACGVSLRLLRAILSDASEVLGPDATTDTVVKEYVKPRTLDGEQRYVDWLLRGGLAEECDVGTPMYFVSHAWGRPFAETVGLTLSHLSDAADTTHVWYVGAMHGRVRSYSVLREPQVATGSAWFLGQLHGPLRACHELRGACGGAAATNTGTLTPCQVPAHRD